MDDLKEIEQLRDAKLRAYSFNTFRKFHANKTDWGTSKKARAVKKSYIVVYSLWHKKLLARTFYLEEGYRNKEKYHHLFEVNRQLAGSKYKLWTRLYASGLGAGFNVWTGENNNGWQISDYKHYHLWAYYNNWSGICVRNYYEYNDPIHYLKKSIHKYCGYEYVPEAETHNNYMFEYLIKYVKHPEYEMLLKFGLWHIIKEAKLIKWNKKGLDMLSIKKQELKYLQSGISLTDYRLVQNMAVKQNYSVDEVKKAIEFHGYYQNPKLIRYATKNKVSLHDYIDYMKFVSELGMPLTNHNLYPLFFKEAHDILMNKVYVLKNELQDEKIKKYAEYFSQYTFQKGMYVIFPVTSTQELIDESKALNHCVRSYAERVAKGETEIMFIRNVENKDKPLYTLELKGEEVVQCRASHNATPCNEAIQFVNYWCNKNNFISCFSRK